jgi:hypothetical protein
MIYQWRFPSWRSLNPRNTYQITPFPFRFQFLCIPRDCPLHTYGFFRDACPESVCLTDSLAMDDWFTFSRRRRCHRSGLCAFHAYASRSGPRCMIRVPLIEAAWPAPPSKFHIDFRLVSHRIRQDRCFILHPWVGVGVPTIEPSSSTPISSHPPSL